jgi:hypothetical protein
MRGLWFDEGMSDVRVRVRILEYDRSSMSLPISLLPESNFQTGLLFEEVVVEMRIVVLMERSVLYGYEYEYPNVIDHKYHYLLRCCQSLTFKLI